MAKLMIIHERWKCIGCGACVAVAPERWELADDGYADIKGARRETMSEGTLERVSINEDELHANQEAAEACPVECIHLQEEKKEKEISGS